VWSVEKGALGGVVIELEGHWPVTVRAYVADSTDDRIPRLARGDKVILNCVGAGRVLGTPALQPCDVASAFTRD